MNVLFVQDSSPCIRNIKYAEALQQMGVNVHLLHRGKTPQEAYGFGNEFYQSISRIADNSTKAVEQIERFCESEAIDVLHYHNYPDKLCAKLLKSGIKVPVVYDQHDFMSQKMRNFGFIRSHCEKVCNERNHGAIYITENYRDLVATKYKINPLNLVFPNYSSKSFVPREDELQDQISNQKGIHLVYVGHITQHKRLSRYMLDCFKMLTERGFAIHIYPTRNKKYEKYAAVRGVVMHEKLPAKLLIREISQYHYGIAFLNSSSVSAKRKQEVKYGFWNKLLDYIAAGVPPITFEYYTDMSKFIGDNKIGLVLPSIEDLTKESLGKVDLSSLRKRIIDIRPQTTCENHICELIEFYEKVMASAHVS
jgi:glycosyltransferase involved in cell wall biosynthesis